MLGWGGLVRDDPFLNRELWLADPVKSFLAVLSCERNLLVHFSSFEEVRQMVWSFSEEVSKAEFKWYKVECYILQRYVEIRS